MATIIQGNELRTLNLGQRASFAYATMAVETKTLFNITGGRVLLTSIYGLVTTSITVAGTSQIQSNPSASGATTTVLSTATDLGTTDTPAGDVLGLTAPGSAIGRGGAVQTLTNALVIPVGAIEQVNATGADGGITWVVTWLPLDNGAALAAA